MIDEIESETERRTVLKMLGITTTVVGLGGVAAAQDDEEGEADDTLPIILAGEAGHWYGLTPQAIHGEENPTLELAEGEEYELVWINIDGTEHDLIIEDSEGEELEQSDETETAGEAVSMTFEATAEMTEYYCQYHPEDMRAAVEIDGGFDLTEFGDETEEENGTNETDD